jgi:hypothetical protein
MNVVPGSVENLTVADEQMLLMRLEFASQDMPFGLPVLTSITARSVITASGSPVFLPSKSLLRIPVEFANKGTLEFTSSGDRPVNLGIQLLSRNGSVERLDFARVSIPHIAAGSKAIVAVEVPIAELNNRNLLILPVQEGVAWFDKFDVKGLEVGPFYACLDKERPWVCNASHIAMPEGK